MRKVLIALASLSLAMAMAMTGLGIMGAAPSQAVPLREVSTFGAGSVPSSLTIAWTGDNPDPSVYIGIAKAAAFSASDPCDYTEWSTASGVPSNLVGYFYQDSVSNPHEFTTYADWNSAAEITVEADTEYVACYFYSDGISGNLGSGSPVFATTSGSAATSRARPIWYLSVGRPSAEASCPDNYTSSWAQWPNAGSGGWVCNRKIFADEPLS